MPYNVIITNERHLTRDLDTWARSMRAHLTGGTESILGSIFNNLI